MPASESSYATLLRQLVSDKPPGKTLLLGVDGAGGSGKSTFARAIEAQDPVHVTVVEMDDFFLPSADRPAGAGADKPIGGDFDWQRVRDQVLEPLHAGEKGRYQRYDWDVDELAEWHDIEPGGIVIVEGIYSTRHELQEYYDLRVWVNAPRDIRLSRGLARDGEEARSSWEDDWMPAEDRYSAEHGSQAHAHLVVDGTGEAESELSTAFVIVEDRRS